MVTNNSKYQPWEVADDTGLKKDHLSVTKFYGNYQDSMEMYAPVEQVEEYFNTTWYQIAPRYHPKPMQMMLWTNYSFEAEYQDAVVYRWLNDSKVWGADIPKLLQQQKLNDVLRKLSPTWTSLGYGIENNSVSSSLPKIYQQILKEELTQNTEVKSI